MRHTNEYISQESSNPEANQKGSANLSRMQSKLVIPACLLLLVNPAMGATAAAALSKGPHYKYTIRTSKDAAVCGHMLQVFNDRFSELWNGPILYPGDPNLSADSKYAFPRVPGVEHDDAMTHYLQFSKLPSSPEFEAISWTEARVVFGDPPASAGPQNNTPRPVLIAYFDFDNDGKVDTVVKHGFTRGYSYMAYSRGGAGLEQEYMTVINSKRLPAEPTMSNWSIDHPKEPDDKAAEAIIAGTYERPFIYQGHTYVAKYDMDLGPDFDADPPLNETMNVVSYSFEGSEDASLSSDGTRDRIDPTEQTVCAYDMKQVANGRK